MSKKYEELAKKINIQYEEEKEITGKEMEDILKKHDAGKEMEDIIVKSIKKLVTDPDELQKYSTMSESELPKNISLVLNGNEKEYYASTGERKVYKKINMTDDELKTEIECQKTIHLASIAKSLKFFVVLVIILIALGVIAGIIALSSM